jgi:hypothetical protein
MIPTVPTVGVAGEPSGNSPPITRVSAESTGPLPSNMYNLGAFDLAVVSSNPALPRDLPALSCEFQRITQHKRDKATSWKQER